MHADDDSLGEIDFPEELDEFLEYCVGEHGDDFDAISGDFLDIAVDLEDPLAQRAHEFFSPEALRRRWLLLCEAAGVTFEGQTSTTPDEGTVAEHPASSAGAAASAALPCQTSAAAGATAAAPRVREAFPAVPLGADGLPEPAPSDFSILNNSLKGQIDKIYLDVQNHLPSATSQEEEDEDEDESDGEVAAAVVGHTGRSDDASAGSSNAGVAAASAAASGLPAAGEESGLHGRRSLPNDLLDSESDDLRLRTIKLFGTDDLSQILRGMPDQGPATPDASPQSGAAATTPSAAGSLPSAAKSPAGKGKGKGKGKGRGAPVAAASSAGSGTEESDDSLDEDFVRARQAMKSSSLGIAADAGPSTAAPRKTSFAPPPRSSAPQTTSKPVNKVPSKFVRLELLETSEDEEDDDKDNQEGAEESGDDNDEENGEEDEPLRVTSHLLSRAPDGECNWDIWLDMMRRWPRLQVKLGTPEFFRRSADLRVRFDVARLREVRVELQAECLERKERKLAYEERLKNGAAEFIREAERRRAMMGGRLQGGFVLTSSRIVKEVNDQQEGDRRPGPEEQDEREANAEEKVKEDQQQSDERRVRMAKELEQRQAKAAALKKRAEDKKLAEAEASRLAEERRREEAKARNREALIEARLAAMRGKHCALFDRQISTGPELRGCAPELQLDDPISSSSAVYVIPWGEAGGSLASAPLVEQRELLSLFHTCGIVQALLLVSVHTLMGTEAGNALSAYAAAVVVILSTIMHTTGFSELLSERLPCCKIVSEVLVGPWQLASLSSLFKNPLALWAFEGGGSESSGVPAMPAGLTSVETQMVCVVLHVPPAGSGKVDKAALATVLASLYEEGIAVVGMRMIFPDDSTAQSVPSAALRMAIRSGQPVLMLALRGPHALIVWRSMLGPADPLLARRTDPNSLNARFGGQSRGETLALAPPSSAARSLADVVWAFGGRIDPAASAAAVPTAQPVHAVSVAAPSAFAVQLQERLSFATAGVVLSGMLLRLGHVVSLAAGGPDNNKLIAVAVREGGGAFLSSCSRLCSEPAIDLGNRLDLPPRSPSADSQTTGRSQLDASVHGEYTASASCDVPSHLGLVLSDSSQVVSPVLAEACRLGEAEVLLLGIRPLGGEGMPLLLREVLDGLYARFGPDGRAPGGRVMSAGLDVGGVVDLIAVRVIDFGLLASHTTPAYAVAALRQFRDFAQLMKRTPDEASDGWWMPRESGAPTVLLCFRGEAIISRFSNFLSKEWKLPASTGGDILFTPTVLAARQAFGTFFSGLGPSAFEQSVPCDNLRSPLRFSLPSVGGVEGGNDFRISEANLFPQKLSNQLTVAMLLPPKLDAVLFRTLTACEQNEFTLVAAVLSGRLGEPIAKTLFDQEVADGHLSSADWPAFHESVAQNAADHPEDNDFKCLWLVFARHQAIKRLAQLCGHGDPSLNQQCLRAALRTGRDHIHNGIRCSTSSATAEGLLVALGRDLSQGLESLTALEPWPPLRSLGVEDGDRMLQCTLIVGALAKDAGFGLVRVLRELQSAVGEQGLVLVGLCASDAAAAAGAAPSGGDSAWLLRQATALNAQLLRWSETRPASSAAVDLAASSGRLILAACEGPVSVERARRALAAVSASMPKGALEWYCSASIGEAAVDVACFFSELHGSKHYIVEG
mmetsp:Transcript_101156/g.325005  ORF Transcript_101156/g.325005 Transcript_101156/m.325005 type:complete len:1658 (-) Transcript_101156:203-5176(-)